MSARHHCQITGWDLIVVVVLWVAALFALLVAVASIAWGAVAI